jgi:hypothetical protein
LDPIFNALYKNDAIYANSDATKYSVSKINEEYLTFSDGIKQKYKGYGLD